jgi:4-hydroxybenzoate polyprenyltransferase
VYSSVWTSLMLAATTGYVEPVWLTFFSGLFIYNVDHISDAHAGESSDQSNRAYFLSRGPLMLLVLAALATGWLAGRAPVAAQVVFASYTAIGLLYRVDFIPVLRQGRWQRARLKDLPGIKSVLVATAITIASVGLPLAWNNQEMSHEAALLALFVLVSMGSNANMFDIRDEAEDRRHRVHSLPVFLGATWTRVLLLGVNFFCTGVLLWAWWSGLVPPRPELALANAATVAYVSLLPVDVPRRVYWVLVDGCGFLPIIFAGIIGSPSA